MEDEVALSDDPKVKAHYQSSSTIYTRVLARIDDATRAEWSS